MCYSVISMSILFLKCIYFYISWCVCVCVCVNLSGMWVCRLHARCVLLMREIDRACIWIISCFRRPEVSKVNFSSLPNVRINIAVTCICVWITLYVHIPRTLILCLSVLLSLNFNCFVFIDLVVKVPNTSPEIIPLSLYHCMFHFNCSIPNPRQTDLRIIYRLQYWLDRQTCTFAISFLFVFLFARFWMCDLSVNIYAFWDFCVFCLRICLHFGVSDPPIFILTCQMRTKTLKVTIYILKVLMVLI